MYIAKEQYVEALQDIANVLEHSFYELTATQEAAAAYEALLLLLKGVGVAPIKKHTKGSASFIDPDTLKREAWKILKESN